MVGKSEWTPAQIYPLDFFGNSVMEPSLVILEDFWLGTGVVMFLGHQMEVWLVVK